jgi:hypothetical protein
VIPVGLPDREGVRKGDEMKRFAIILLAVTTALVMALPATAEKPPKPDPAPELPTTYTVEIEFGETGGIATTCGDPITVTRSDARRGATTHFESEGARLSVQAEGLEFEGESIGGCRGSGEYPEYFRITFDGDQVAMLWIFDVGETEKPVVLKNGKVRYQRVRTDFRMGGPYDGDDFAPWGHEVDAKGVITTSGTATFAFVQYDSGRDPGFVELTNWLQNFELEITLTPIRLIPEQS